MLNRKKDVRKFHKMVMMLKSSLNKSHDLLMSNLSVDQQYMATEFRPRKLGEAKG